MEGIVVGEFGRKGNLRGSSQFYKHHIQLILSYLKKI